jgi:hypothetical protein
MRLFIMAMKRRFLAFYGGLFLILALLLSLTALFLHQASRFTFNHRDFQPPPVQLVLLAALFFVLLLSGWVLYGRAATALFALEPAEVLSRDFLSFLPLLVLSLAPLALRHYIDARDLRERLWLFVLAAAGALLYLKVISFRRWAAASGKPPGRKWSLAFQALAARKRLLILFAAALLVFNSGSLLLISRGITFGGDEPHYLLIAHSLLRDHDFDLANNYARKDYSEFMMFHGEIAPHVVTGARPGSLYSFHSPGVSFLLLPFYAAGALLKGKAFLFMIRLGMSVWGALFAAQVYLLACQQWGKERLALWLWFLTSFTAPVFFYAIHVYPEIIVAFLGLTAYRLLRYSPALTGSRAAVCGLFLGAFIWFHALKYLALLLPLFVYGLWAVHRKSASRAVVLLYTLVPAAVVLLYLQFQHALYGTYSLFAVSWARPATAGAGESARFAGSVLFGIPLRDRLETLAGYFLDQRDGLLFYSPLFFLSFLGAWEMFKKKRRELLLLLFLGAPYVLLSASLTQRTGYAPQARPLVAVIWVLAIGLGYFLASNAATIFAHLGKLAAGASLLFAGLLLLYPLNLYQETTRGATQRGGGLFYLLGNLHFNPTGLLPSYLKVEDRRWSPNLIWPVVLGLLVLAYALSKRSPLRLRFAAHVAAACAGMLVFFVWFVLYPRLVLLGPTRVALPSGDTVTFYSLSRSARRAEGGGFLLREDGRSYRFYLTTDRPLQDLALDFGSVYGEYDASVRLFDEPLFEEKTVRAVRTFALDSPPRYRLGRRSFYAIVLELGKGSVATGDQTPYRFTIDGRESPR